MQLSWSNYSLIAWRRFMAIVIGAVLIATAWLRVPRGRRGHASRCLRKPEARAAAV